MKYTLNPGFSNIFKYAEVEDITPIPIDPYVRQHHVELQCSEGLSTCLICEFAKWVIPLTSGGIERSLNQLVASLLHLAWR